MSATATRKLFVNWFTGQLQISDREGSPFILPPFTKYETVPFEIVIVEPDLATPGVGRFRRVDISGLSLTVSINDTLDDSAPLVQQGTWDKDEISNIFSGELSLNTAGMNSAVGASATIPAYFEIKFGEGTSAPVIYIAQITVRNAVTQPITTVPAPVTEYLTKQQIAQQFCKKVMDPGETITFTSPDGLTQRVMGCGDGASTPIDQFFAA